MVEMRFLKTDIFSIHIEIDGAGGYYNASGLIHIFDVLFVIGVLLFQFAKAKRILTFCLSIIFISTTVSIFQSIHWFFSDTTNDNSWQFVLWSIKAVIVFFVLLILLRKLLESDYREDENPSLTRYPDFQWQRSKWYDRLFHFWIDTFMIILLFSGLVLYYPDSIGEVIEYYVGPIWTPSLLFFICSSFYYLFFEGILKTTPGKILTHSRIVSLDGKSTDFGRIVGRTLARQIPFDGLSFLGTLGWHDSLSGTTLVKLKKENKNHIAIYIVIFLLILITLLCFIFYELFRW
jgi:hypothetical protein